jgi:group I intron endonuclease
MGFKDLHSENNNDIYKTGVYTIEFINKPRLYYVGSTKAKGNINPSTQGFYSRWCSHVRSLKKGNHSNIYLQRIVNKYGLSNIRFKILDIVEPEYVRYSELYWITILNTSNSKYGYNTGHVCLKDVKFKLSQKTKDKISVLKSKKVLQYSYDGIFIKEYDSCTAAAKKVGVSTNSITESCTVKDKSRKSSAGFLWRFKTKNYPHRIDAFYPDKSRDDFKKKKVVQYNITTNEIITIFETLNDAVAFLKCERSNLIRVLKRKYGGKTGKYRGFYWEYYN